MTASVASPGLQAGWDLAESCPRGERDITPVSGTGSTGSSPVEGTKSCGVARRWSVDLCGGPDGETYMDNGV